MNERANKRELITRAYGSRALLEKLVLSFLSFRDSVHQDRTIGSTIDPAIILFLSSVRTLLPLVPYKLGIRLHRQYRHRYPPRDRVR